MIPYQAGLIVVVGVVVVDAVIFVVGACLVCSSCCLVYSYLKGLGLKLGNLFFVIS